MHQSQAHAPEAGRRTFWRVYMAVWVVLSGVSLAYLTLFAGNRDAQRHVAARIDAEILQSQPVSVAKAPVASETDPELSDKVRALNDELASLRQKLKQAQETGPAADASGGASSPFPSAGGTPEQADARTDATPSSPLTTASIPRIEAPAAAAERDDTGADAATTNPFATNESVVLTDQMRPGQSTLSATESGSTQTEPATPATVTAPPRRNLNGQNLAIRPLRPGSAPPLPTRAHARTSAAAQPAAPRATAPVNATTGTFAQPTVLNSDTPPPRAEPAAVRPRILINPADQPAARRTVTPTVTSPQPAPTSFGAATVRPTTSPSALVLSSAGSVTGLRASWLVLTTQHGPTLGDLTPRYVTDAATGTYRLLAGPIADRAEADRRCSELIGQGVRCGVGTYTGSRF